MRRPYQPGQALLGTSPPERKTSPFPIGGCAQHSIKTNYALGAECISVFQVRTRAALGESRMSKASQMKGTILSLRQFAYVNVSVILAVIPSAFLIFGTPASASAQGYAASDPTVIDLLTLIWLLAFILFRSTSAYTLRYILVRPSPFTVYTNIAYILAVIAFIRMSREPISVALFFLILLLQFALFCMSTPLQTALAPQNNERFRRLAYKQRSFLIFFSVALISSASVAILAIHFTLLESVTNSTTPRVDLPIAALIAIIGVFVFASALTDRLVRASYRERLWR